MFFSPKKKYSVSTVTLCFHEEKSMNQPGMSSLDERIVALEAAAEVQRERFEALLGAVEGISEYLRIVGGLEGHRRDAEGVVSH